MSCARRRLPRKDSGRRAALDGLLATSFLTLFALAGLLTGAVVGALLLAGRAQQARETASAALRESEERFRNIAASAQDAIIEMDGQGRVAYWNRGAERLFDYPGEEAQGQDLHRLIAPQRFQGAFQANFPRFLASGEGAMVGKTIEVVGLRRDGSEIPVEIAIAAVNGKAGRSAIGIIRNIRERKEAEQGSPGGQAQASRCPVRSAHHRSNSCAATGRLNR